MPDPWSLWDEKVKRTGRPVRVVEELNDVELLVLLSDANPRRAREKQLLRQEAYRRMGHKEAVPPGLLAQGEPDRDAYAPGAFSGLPSRGDGVDPL